MQRLLPQQPPHVDSLPESTCAAPRGADYVEGGLLTLAQREFARVLGRVLAERWAHELDPSSPKFAPPRSAN